MPSLIAVFGASGPVGHAIMGTLGRDPLLTPVAIHRRPHAGPATWATRLATLQDPASLAAALRGCAVVVNALGGPPATLAANTATLCRAAREAGMARLVHISSMAVYGATEGMVAETAGLAPHPTAYQAAKIASEMEVRALEQDGRDAVILRPGLVFGPGSVQWAHRMERLLRAHRLGDLGAAGDGYCNLTHEADLGAAVRAALLAPEAAGLAINLASAAPPSWNDFFEVFSRALGAVPLRRIGRRRLAFEARALAPVLHVARRAGSIGRRLPEPIPPSLLRLFGQRLRLDPTLADRVLAIRRMPDREAIAATAARLRAA